MQILLPLLLCVCATARVAPAISSPVPEKSLIQNAKVQGGTQQPTKPLVTTSIGSSKIHMSKSKDAIQYSYIVVAVTGTKMAQLNATIAQIDKQQKAAFAKETNAKVKSYFKSKTKSGYGGMLLVGLGALLPFFAGYYLNSVVQELAKNPQIKYITQNVKAGKPMSIVTQNNAPWHLGKISASPNDNTYYVLSLNAVSQYRYSHYAGYGVPIYIVDHIWGMGQDIRYSVPLRVLSQRAVPRRRVLHGVVQPPVRLHGEMVAAFAARQDVGVAKGAQIVMVDSGIDMADITKAVDTAILDYQQNLAHYSQGAVINISIQFDLIFYPSPLRDAITWVLQNFHSVTFVVAAGNAEVDACNYDFNLSPEAIKVSALNERLEVAPGFAYGACVDILAPGTNLEYEGENVHGTSFSAPMVSGLAAYFYSLAPKLGSGYLANNGAMKWMMTQYAFAAGYVPGQDERGTPELLVNNAIDFFN